jgi:hypothetical protein
MRSARSWAATPGPGRFFGQAVTIFHSRLSCAIAGVASVAAAAAPATPAFRNFLLCMSVPLCFEFTLLFSPQYAGQIEPVLACAIERDVVAGIGMTPDTGSRIVPQHPLEPRAAASVPCRRTMTMPECCEKPMPTPPPWCIDTQVAPDAVLTSALSSGQSLTASEPSFMDSVSRLGDATEPESR